MNLDHHKCFIWHQYPGKQIQIHGTASYELHPDNLNTEEGLSLSWSLKPLIQTMKNEEVSFNDKWLISSWFYCPPTLTSPEKGSIFPATYCPGQVLPCPLIPVVAQREHYFVPARDSTTSYTPSPVCVHFVVPFTSPWRWKKQCPPKCW